MKGNKKRSITVIMGNNSFSDKTQSRLPSWPVYRTVSVLLERNETPYKNNPIIEIMRTNRHSFLTRAYKVLPCMKNISSSSTANSFS